MNVRTQESVARRPGFLSQSKHMDLMLLCDALNEPQEARHDPILTTPIHTAGNEQADLHTCPSNVSYASAN